MYQSIPKRVYTTKESAMPRLPSTQPFANEKRASNPIANRSKLTQKIKDLQTDDLLLIGLFILLLSEEGDHDLLIVVIACLLLF